jgi:hypothetical protein
MPLPRSPHLGNKPKEQTHTHRSHSPRPHPSPVLSAADPASAPDPPHAQEHEVRPPVIARPSLSPTLSPHLTVSKDSSVISQQPARETLSGASMESVRGADGVWSDGTECCGDNWEECGEERWVAVSWKRLNASERALHCDPASR